MILARFRYILGEFAERQREIEVNQTDHERDSSSKRTEEARKKNS
jgi:hypothetical protein